MLRCCGRLRLVRTGSYDTSLLPTERNAAASCALGRGEALSNLTERKTSGKDDREQACEKSDTFTYITPTHSEP